MSEDELREQFEAWWGSLPITLGNQSAGSLIGEAELARWVHESWQAGTKIKDAEIAELQELLSKALDERDHFYNQTLEHRLEKIEMNTENKLNDKEHAEGQSRLNVGLDDTVRYWLCCGSEIYPHGAKTCYEAQMVYPNHVRFGTAKEHSEWQLKEMQPLYIQPKEVK
jgi:hypothetical protein